MLNNIYSKTLEQIPQISQEEVLLNLLIQKQLFILVTFFFLFLDCIKELVLKKIKISIFSIMPLSQMITFLKVTLHWWFPKKKKLLKNDFNIAWSYWCFSVQFVQHLCFLFGELQELVFCYKCLQDCYSEISQDMQTSFSDNSYTELNFFVLVLTIWLITVYVVGGEGNVYPKYCYSSLVFVRKI